MKMNPNPMAPHSWDIGYLSNSTGTVSGSSEDYAFKVKGTFINIENSRRKIRASRKRASSDPARVASSDQPLPTDKTLVYEQEEYTKALPSKLKMWKEAKKILTRTTLDSLPAEITLDNLTDWRSECPSTMHSLPGFRSSHTVDSLPLMTYSRGKRIGGACQTLDSLPSVDEESVLMGAYESNVDNYRDESRDEFPFLQSEMCNSVVSEEGSNCEEVGSSWCDESVVAAMSKSYDEAPGSGENRPWNLEQFDDTEEYLGHVCQVDQFVCNDDVKPPAESAVNSVNDKKREPDAAYDLQTSTQFVRTSSEKSESPQQHIVSALFSAIGELPDQIVRLLQDELVQRLGEGQRGAFQQMVSIAGAPQNIHGVVLQTLDLIKQMPPNVNRLLETTLMRIRAVLHAQTSWAPLQLLPLIRVLREARIISVTFLHEALRMWSMQAIHILNYTVACIRKEHPRLGVAEFQLHHLSQELTRLAEVLGRSVEKSAADLAIRAMDCALLEAEAAAAEVRLPRGVADEADECMQCEPPSATLSRGSLGHPHLCNRPCRFATEGCCATGAQCGFCHFPHDRRTVHLDKKSRDLFRRLPMPGQSAIVSNVICDKMEEMGIHVGDGQELGAWAVELGLPLGCGRCDVPELPGFKPADIRRLRVTLKSSTFLNLCSLLSKSGEDPDFVKATQTLLRSIRLLTWTQDAVETRPAMAP